MSNGNSLLWAGAWWGGAHPHEWVEIDATGPNNRWPIDRDIWTRFKVVNHATYPRWFALYMYGDIGWLQSEAVNVPAGATAWLELPLFKLQLERRHEAYFQLWTGNVSERYDFSVDTMRVYRWAGKYTLPAWYPTAYKIDGIYVNENLFENNRNPTDSRLMIIITPSTGLTLAQKVVFAVPSYNNGQVEYLEANFLWTIGQSHEQIKFIDYGGHPYGMGLNIIQLVIWLGAVLPYKIEYDVRYTMEVII